MADTKPDPDDSGGEDAATEEIVAYLDGELDPKEAEAIATRIGLDPKLRAEAESLQRAWDILDVLPRPQPTPNFASRTLSQAISRVAAPSGTQVVPLTAPAARSSSGFWFSSIAMIVVAALGGYFGHMALAPAPKAASPDPPLEDVTLMKNMRLYRHLDDMEYLKQLDAPDLFEDESEPAVSSAYDALFKPDDPSYLRRQYVWFQAQSSARQQQLRRLHEDFVGLDSADQARFTRVMQTYNGWLTRLPEPDRNRIATVASPAARLEVVKQIREREWVDSLPRPYRHEYAKLEGDARRQQVQEWRTEEAERRDEWALAQQHWMDNPPGKVPAMFLNEGRGQIEAFVTHLRENLSEAERKDLEDARTAADDYGNYFWYAREVVRLADLHPILPGRVGPKDFVSLPEQVRESLRKQDPHFRQKGDGVKELRKAVGRWPDFAVELTRYCQKNKLTLPGPLGDARKDQMPPEIVQFLDRVLEPQLKRSEQGRADLDALAKAQGTWPEYPRMILDLAKKYKMHAPGWTLPGPPQAWNVLRAGKNRQK